MALSKYYNLFDQADERFLGEELALLAEISHGFATSLDIKKTLQNALQQFMEHLHAEAASIFLLENGGKEIVCHGCAGPVDITGMRMSAGKGIVGRAVSSKSCQMVRDVSREPDFAREVDQGSGFETRSILCAPLIVNGECIGALELLNKREGLGLFGEQDRHLVTVLASAAALAIHNAWMADELLQGERLRKEHEFAHEIQRNLLKGEVLETGQSLTSNFYDFFQRDDGLLYFSLGTVAGEGVSSTLLMAEVSYLLRYLAKRCQEPGEYLALVNGEICATGNDSAFITMVSGFINPETGEVSLVNAGNQPLLFHKSDGSYDQIQAAAPPLGVEPEAAFPGDSFILNGGSLFIFNNRLEESVGRLEQEEMIQLTRMEPKACITREEQGVVAEVRKYDHNRQEYLSLVLIDNKPPAE